METKKTLCELLIDDKNKFNHIEAEKLCRRLQKFSPKIFDYSKEQRTTIYRFSVLVLNYLNSECNREDFSIESFFKILCVEVGEAGFGSARNDVVTAFDIMCEDAYPNSSTIYMMHKYYLDLAEHMPENSFEFFSEAWQSIARDYALQYDKEAIHFLWTSYCEEFERKQREREQKREQQIVLKSEEAILNEEILTKIDDLFAQFWTYVEDRDREYYYAAQRTLEDLQSMRVGEDLEALFETFEELIYETYKLCRLKDCYEELFSN